MHFCLKKKLSFVVVVCRKMGGSRRRLKKSRQKIRCGLPRKNPNVFKPAFSIPERLLLANPDKLWDNEGSVIDNYKAFGVVSNPNLLGVRARTPHIVQDPSLQVPATIFEPPKLVNEFDPIDSGSDLENDGSKLGIFFLVGLCDFFFFVLLNAE